MVEYVPLSRTKSNFVKGLELKFEGIDVLPLWQDRTIELNGEDARSGCSFRYELDPNEPNTPLYEHSLIPALEDIEAFEKAWINKGKRNDLTLLQEQGAVFLHAMGEYRSFGTRYLVVVSPAGKVDVYYPEDLAETKETWSVSSNSSIDNVVKQVTIKLLEKTPEATLFLHYPGTIPQKDLIEPYIVPHPNYRFIQQQITQDDIESGKIPRGLVMSVVEVANYEANFSPEMTYFVMFGYRFEEDHATYALVAPESWEHGKVWGLNNRRAMKGMIKRLKKVKTFPFIFTHRMGSEIDFELTRKIFEEDKLPQVQRRKERD